MTRLPPSLLLVLAQGLLALPACSQKYAWSDPPDTAEADADTDTDTDADTDTDTDTDTGTDEDGDGFTLEDGDCDDTDIYVNPAREEEPADGKDNDCDGRTDEAWSGVTVAWYDFGDYENASLVTLDTLGRKIGEVTIGGESIPLWMDQGLDGGWLINNGQFYVSTVGEDGTLTTLADFSEDDMGAYGVATHPDGFYLVTTMDDLWRIDPDGTLTQLATWSADTSDPATFDMVGYTLAVDFVTGEVAIYCLYGGFAVWSEADGLTIHRRADVENWDGLYTYSGAYKDGGGWYSLSMDGNTGQVGVSRFNLADGTWVQKAAWSAGQWFPNALAFDGDSGDYYVTANGGWHYTVWRMLADGSYLADFYDSYEEYPDAQNRGFYGIVSNY